MSDDIEQTKQAYIKDLHAQLNDWDSGLDLLKSKAEDTVFRAKAEFDEQIKVILEKSEAAGTPLQGLKQTHDRVWEDVTDGLQQAWEQLHSALEQARSRFE